MSTSLPQISSTNRWRAIAFVLVVVLQALLFLFALGGLVALLAPWILLPAPEPMHVPHPEIHRWHSAQHGVLVGILLTGSLFSLLWQGEQKPLVAQFFLLAVFVKSITAIALRPTDPANYIIPIFIIGSFVLTYPARRSLLTFSREGSWVWSFLILSLFTLILLIPTLWQESIKHIANNDEHAWVGHWADSVMSTLLLIFGGGLTATRHSGWKTLGGIVGIVFLYLGVSAIVLPSDAGSWGMGGGVLGILAGLACIIVVGVEMRHEFLGFRRGKSVRKPI